MDLYDVAWHLSDILETNRAVFLKLEPEVPDFTISAPFKAIVCGMKDRIEIEVTPQNIMSVVGMFDATIFDKEKVERLYVWNFKSLVTYFHYFTQKFITPSNSLIDLKIIESFLNIVGKKSPENLVEVINRTKLAVQHKGWQTLYKSVHLPLALRVLPTIESTPLLNEAAKRPEHPYYEIEGQINGRLNCLKKFTKCYLPHTMGPDVTSALKPKGYGYRFLYTDFHYCEICVLQWLSKDEVLGEMLETGVDLYSHFYQKVTGDPCDSESKRKKGKMMLIAVIYGSGGAGLAKSLGVPEAIGVELIRRIELTIPTACGWLDEQQRKAKSGQITDYFGRPRKFTEAYLARNFVVQGVAATVCQELLIELHKVLTNKEDAYIAFSVHDGYGLVVRTQKAREIYKLVKQTLQAESKLCPGLKMKVDIKFGAKLNSMKVLWKD